MFRVEDKGILDLKKFSQGHRGLIYTGKLDGKNIVVKRQRSDIQTFGRIANEARWLKVLNRKSIGPNFLFLDDDFFIYNFVNGIPIPEFLLEYEKSDIIKVLKNVFDQCFVLDSLLVNKEEMHNPYKHILIEDNVPVMLDFERCHSSEHPKNVTQFCQFVGSTKVLKILKAKNFKLTNCSSYCV